MNTPNASSIGRALVAAAELRAQDLGAEAVLAAHLADPQWSRLLHNVAAEIDREVLTERRGMLEAFAIAAVVSEHPIALIAGVERALRGLEVDHVRALAEMDRAARDGVSMAGQYSRFGDAARCAQGAAGRIFLDNSPAGWLLCSAHLAVVHDTWKLPVAFVSPLGEDLLTLLRGWLAPVEAAP